MKILHYFLGFPPYRSGGLTRYANDLMHEQVQEKHQVSALWPGQIQGFGSLMKIKKRKNIDGIQNFELINPLPVPLDEGIREIDSYMQAGDVQVYGAFLDQVRPDVIHIHTLMGLHPELMVAAVQRHIRTVYTAHDYFGICPKVNLFHEKTTCEDDHNCADCIGCNESALSLKKIQLMQSPAYRMLKDFWPVKMMRRRHRENFFSEQGEEQQSEAQKKLEVSSEQAARYRQLREFYISMLQQMDCIHFNSTVTEKVYRKYLIPKKSLVMNISHKGIADHRRQNDWQPSPILRLTMLAPAKPYKGFFVLRNALDALWQKGKRDFVLQMFCQVPSPRPYMKVRENGFSQTELAQIFGNTDLLVAPSIWYETFGFTVLEAISYGTPVLVSDHVGAKDIVDDGGIIVPAGSADELEQALDRLNPQKLSEMRDAISRLPSVLDWKQFVKNNYSLYEE